MLLDETHSGGTIEVGVGETVTIRLTEKPSTGYRWIPLAVGGLRETGSRFESGGAIGGEGVRVFEFQASKPGRSDLRIEHRREWEPDGQRIGQFEVSLIAG